MSEYMGVALRERSDLHLVRKIWHIGSGLPVLYLIHKTPLGIHGTAYFLLGLASVNWILDILRQRSPMLNDCFVKIFGLLMRKHEYGGPTTLSYYALGIALSLLLFSPKLAILATLFLIFADPVASFVGVLFGKDKILPNKSFQGTLAAFCVCYLLSLFYGIQYVHPSVNFIIFTVVAGIIGSLSELMSVIIDDNLAIPLFSGIGLTLLNSFLNVF